MWTVDHRRTADRKGLCYSSDLTEAEWALVGPLIPPAKHGGRKRSVDVREVLNGIFYVLSTGCQWPALPRDLPPKSTVYDYFDLWEWDGTLERIRQALHVEVREQAGRQASPSAAINVQDRDGAAELLRRTRRPFPFIEVIYADGGYQGPKIAAVAAKTGASRLVQISAIELVNYGYNPAYPKGALQSVKLATLRDWIMVATGSHQGVQA